MERAERAFDRAEKTRQISGRMAGEKFGSVPMRTGSVFCMLTCHPQTTGRAYMIQMLGSANGEGVSVEMGGGDFDVAYA